MNFAEVLQGLVSTDGLLRLDMLDAAGRVVATIENRPGTAGSFRVYHHVSHARGVIDAGAAREALALFSEHTADASQNPGKHPNIDRLFRIIDANEQYSIRVQET